MLARVSLHAGLVVAAMVAAETEPRRWALRRYLVHVEGEIFHLSESEPEGALTVGLAPNQASCAHSPYCIVSSVVSRCRV